VDGGGHVLPLSYNSLQQEAQKLVEQDGDFDAFLEKLQPLNHSKQTRLIKKVLRLQDRKMKKLLKERAIEIKPLIESCVSN